MFLLSCDANVDVKHKGRVWTEQQVYWTTGRVLVQLALRFLQEEETAQRF